MPVPVPVPTPVPVHTHVHKPVHMHTRMRARTCTCTRACALEEDCDLIYRQRVEVVAGLDGGLVVAAHPRDGCSQRDDHMPVRIGV